MSWRLGVVGGLLLSGLWAGEGQVVAPVEARLGEWAGCWQSGGGANESRSTGVPACQGMELEPEFPQEWLLAQDSPQREPLVFEGQLSEESRVFDLDGSYFNVHTFTGQAGETLKIDLVSDEFDALVILLDPDSNNIAQNNDGGENENARLVITLPADGEYSILANSYQAGEVGEYQITLQGAMANNEVAVPSAEGDEADQLFDEGYALVQEGTADSLRAAIEKFEAAIPLYQAVNNTFGEAAVLLNSGNVYADLGLRAEALETYQKSLTLWQELTENTTDQDQQTAQNQQAITLNSIGLVYSNWGEYRGALNYFNQALPLLQRVGDRAGEATTLNNIGTVYHDLWDMGKALEYYEQALPLYQAVDDRAGEATLLNNMALVYSVLGQKRQALESLQQVLAIDQEIGNDRDRATTLHNIARSYSDLEDYNQALAYYDQALLLKRKVGDLDGEGQTLGNMAWVHLEQENPTDARRTIQSALDIFEQLRTATPPGELRQAYVATVQGYYLLYLDILMALHQQNPNSPENYAAQAFQLSEGIRARVLVEQLAEANLDIRAGVDPQLLDRERQLTQQLSATEQRRITLTKGGSASQAEIDAIKAKIQQTLQNLQTVESQIRSQSPAYAQLKFPEPLTLQQVQDQILDHNTLLLEYVVGEFRGFLFVVSKTDLHIMELPDRITIEMAVNAYLEKLRDPTFTDLSQGDALSQMLLGTIPEKNPDKRLLIVSNGKLQRLPFAALPLPVSPPEVPGDTLPTVPLIAQHEIINLPSATTLAIQRQTWADRAPAPKTIALIADPVFEANDDRFADNVNPEDLGNQDLSELIPLEIATRAGCLGFQRLENTAIEAKNILNLVPNGETLLATGFDANHATATSSDLNQYNILHLATHGCIQDNARLSNLALSSYQENGEFFENSALHLQDIYNLKLNAELVVLSACETGTGNDVAGEGIVGMTSGFMYAGAKRVLVSLWSVSDVGTADLMTKYYQAMWQDGRDPHTALREAQLEFWLSGGDYRAPYYWAAFTMQGEF
ncbi:CHAT domain-containing protein [Spirulina major]|uniref:CHAT domain-containing protein n=1 Tax=Spirulina major TaxID=270636 RepID=UPI001114C7CF|nr:CHAT domain-containing protein [Spirulina major]